MARSSGSVIGGGRDLDGGQLDGFRAQRLSGSARAVGLSAVAGDDDALAEERQPLEPIKLLAQRTTSPMMMVAGGFMSRCSISPGSVARVPTSVS